jgi:hypothetical protein
MLGVAFLAVVVGLGSFYVNAQHPEESNVESEILNEAVLAFEAKERQLVAPLEASIRAVPGAPDGLTGPNDPFYARIRAQIASNQVDRFEAEVNRARRKRQPQITPQVADGNVAADERLTDAELHQLREDSANAWEEGPIRDFLLRSLE